MIDTFRDRIRAGTAAGLLVLAAGGAEAQPLTASIDTASAARFGCPGGLATATTIRCCLTILDGGILADPSASGEDVAAARAFESSLLDALKTLSAPDEPRVCPLPVSYPPVLGSVSSAPVLKQPRRIGGPGPRGGEQPLPPRGFGSFPRFQIGLGLGMLVTEHATDIPVGGGTTQRFPALPWSGGALDLRLAWLFALAATSDEPEIRRLTAPLLGLYVGYSVLRAHVDVATNIGGLFGGTTNTAFEGTTEIRRPYLGLGLTLPLNGNAPGSPPPLGFFVGATVGYSFIELSENNGPFRNEREGADFGVEVGFDVGLDRGWTARPSVSTVFDPAGAGGDPVTRVQVMVIREF